MITIKKTCRYYQDTILDPEDSITYDLCTKHAHDINGYLDCKDCPGFEKRACKTCIWLGKHTYYEYHYDGTVIKGWDWYCTHHKKELKWLNAYCEDYTSNPRKRRHGE